MRRAVCLIACCCLGPGVIAGGPANQGGKLTDPKEILKRADEALKKTKLISYQADYKGTKWARQFVPDMQATVIVGEPSDFDIPRFFCDATVTREKGQPGEEAVSSEQKTSAEQPPSGEKPPATEPFRVTAGCDGDQYFLIDPKTKTAHQDMDPAVLGTRAGDVQRVIAREFTADDPFKAALESNEIELKGEVTIGDEPCYEIHSKIVEGMQQGTVWAVSARDFLPRQIKRVYKMPQFGEEEGTTELIMTQLVVDPKPAKDPFKLVVPEGYKKTDEFAP